MANTQKDTRTITAGAIFDEAEAAKLTAREILERLTGSGEDEKPDPVAELLAAIQTLVQGQAVILRRLDTIERLLGGRAGGSGR